MLSFCLHLVPSPLSAQQVDADRSTNVDESTEYEPDSELSPTLKPVGPRLKSERTVEDLDNRDDAPPGLGEALLWGPRVAFYPVYLSTEYLVRRPLHYAVKQGEKYHVVPRTMGFFTWNEGRSGLFPLIYVDTGFAPSYGLNFFWRDFLIENYDIDLGVQGNVGRNVDVDVGNRYRIDALNGGLIGRFRFQRRDDYTFHGFGSLSQTTEESRFFRHRLGGEIGFNLDDLPSGIGGSAFVNTTRFTFECAEELDDDICGPDHRPNTGDEIHPLDSAGGITNFSDGHTLLETRLHIHWDTRPPRPAPGTGIRLEADGRYGRGISDTATELQYVIYGGEVAGFVDTFDGGQRVLGLRVRSKFVDPVAGEAIPFTRYVQVGGVESMRGFQTNRFRGRSSLVGTLNYEYPIWSFLDGAVFFEAGNVFEEHLQNFDTDLLRLSGGIGLRKPNGRGSSIDVNIAAGTTRLGERNFGIDFVRFNIGTNRGF